MKGHGCLLSGWQAPEFSCKCLIFRCESIYYPHDHLFLIRSVKNEYEWIAGKWRDSGWQLKWVPELVYNTFEFFIVRMILDETVFQKLFDYFLKV